MEEKDVDLKLVKQLYQKRKFIVFTTLFFLIAAIGITFFIPKRYVAYAVVYPTKSNSIKNMVVDADFGFEIHADRLIQLFESDEVKKNIMKEFDLVNYYELDTNKPGWKYNLNKNYSKDLQFSRTRYLSVAIEAKFKDPSMAANIANRSVDLVDSARKNIFQSNIISLINSYQEKLKKQETIVANLLYKISEGKKGDPGSKRLAENNLKHINERINKGELVGGDEIIKKTLQSNYSIESEFLINDYYAELGKLNQLRQDIDKANEQLELPFPPVHRIIRAEVDDKKVSPSFSTNAILGLFSGFLISIFLVLSSFWVKQFKEKMS